MQIDTILSGLNEEQKAAVQATEGPVLIVAGAGSGKTRVLTSRIAYLLQGGCQPSRILALTFTKKAAGEMKERIALMVGADKARHLVMGTFHAVFVRFLREYSEFLGYPAQFTIYDTSDSQSAIKACLKELKLDDKVYKPKDVLSRISNAKNNLMTVEAYKADQNIRMQDLRSQKGAMAQIYELYQRKMKQAGVMDFDDILVNMNILLRDNKDALLALSDRFSYIMVDEYQDTNFAQYLIIKKLSQYHKNICVVGDDSQSIYAFRGAKVENILNFKRDYPECKTYRLERNYRSTQTIVDAANSLIAHNEARIPKVCYSEGEQGDKIHIIQSYSDQEEAVLVVADIIDKMRDFHAQYSDFAILYRTNSQSRAFEEVLRRRNIPYMIYSGNSFFERAEVKDLMAYLKLAINPNDDESFKRIIAKPSRGIGDTTMALLDQAAHKHQTSYFKAAYLEDLPDFGLKESTIAKVKTFTNTINGWFLAINNTDAFELATKIANESGLVGFYKSDTSIEGLARMANIDELLNSVSQYVEDCKDEYELNNEEAPTILLPDYIENVSLLSAVDVREDEDTNNKVSLMTVHSSKGLEYPFVSIVGLEENLFPSLSMLGSKADIEEERRLFYVALTRAKKGVTMSMAASRMRNGKHEDNPPSRFLCEIDAKYFDNPLTKEDFLAAELNRAKSSFGGFGKKFGSGNNFPPQSRLNYGKSSQVTIHKLSPSQGMAPAPTRTPVQPHPVPTEIPGFIPDPISAFSVGCRVQHARFGGGKIVDMTGIAPDLRAIIDFDNFGQKTIMLRVAKLRLEK